MKRNYLVSFLMRRGAVVVNKISFWLANLLGRERFSVSMDGRLLYAPASVSGGLRRSLIKGAYENDERIILYKVLDQNDAIIEFGGAIGVLAVTYANLSPLQHLSLEPNPEIAGFLKSNLERTGVDNVEVLEAAASWTDGNCQFFVNENFYSSSITRHEGREIIVPCVDVNRMVAERNINTIVSDVEGFEYELFKNIDLAPIRKIIIEIHETEDTAQAISSLLALFCDSSFNFDVKAWRGNVLVFRK